MISHRKRRQEPCNDWCGAQNGRAAVRRSTCRGAITNVIGATGPKPAPWATKVNAGDHFATKKLVTVAVRGISAHGMVRRASEKGGVDVKLDTDEAGMGFSLRTKACLETRKGVVNERGITGLNDGHISCSVTRL